MVFETTRIDERKYTPVIIRLGFESDAPETNFSELEKQIGIIGIEADALPGPPETEDFEGSISEVEIRELYIREYVAHIVAGTIIGKFLNPIAYYMVKDSKGRKRVFRIRRKNGESILERWTQTEKKWKKYNGKVLDVTVKGSEGIVPIEP